MKLLVKIIEHWLDKVSGPWRQVRPGSDSWNTVGSPGGLSRGFSNKSEFRVDVKALFLP